MVALMSALSKVYNGERVWKDIGDRLQVPHCLSRGDHYWKIRARNKEQTFGNFPL
jgi:hypothetical protein